MKERYRPNSCTLWSVVVYLSGLRQWISFLPWATLPLRPEMFWKPLRCLTRNSNHFQVKPAISLVWLYPTVPCSGQGNVTSLVSTLELEKSRGWEQAQELPDWIQLWFTALIESHAPCVPWRPSRTRSLQAQNHHILGRRVIGAHWACSEHAEYTMLELCAAHMAEWNK